MNGNSSICDFHSEDGCPSLLFEISSSLGYGVEVYKRLPTLCALVAVMHINVSFADHDDLGCPES